MKLLRRERIEKRKCRALRSGGLEDSYMCKYEKGEGKGIEDRESKTEKRTRVGGLKKKECSDVLTSELESED
jgi:hypothetical protein